MPLDQPNPDATLPCIPDQSDPYFTSLYPPLYTYANIPDMYQAFYFLNIAMKDRLLPSFCTFSALRSIALFCVGIAGIGGLSIAGLATLLKGTDDVPPLNGRSLGLVWANLRLLCFWGKAETLALEAF